MNRSAHSQCDVLPAKAYRNHDTGEELPIECGSSLDFRQLIMG